MENDLRKTLQCLKQTEKVLPGLQLEWGPSAVCLTCVDTSGGASHWHRSAAKTLSRDVNVTRSFLLNHFRH